MQEIRVDDAPAYIEINVWSNYDLNRLEDNISAMPKLHRCHGHFSELETYHDKVNNDTKAFVSEVCC